MGKDSGCGGVDVEVMVVVAGDGEVPHPAVVVGRGGAAACDGAHAVGGLQVLALLELGGGDLLLEVGVPEEVVGVVWMTWTP